MKKPILFFLVGLLFFTNSGCRRDNRADYPISPVPFTDVGINDSFWQPRMETNRIVTIPFAMKKNEETGRVENLRIAAHLKEGVFTGRRFNDTDVFKVMEGAAYSLKIYPDPELEKQLDDLIAVIAAAQERDGYLYAARTADPSHPAPGAGPERWSRLRGSHELYNAGHMYEAAVAHYQATGKKSFLDIAVKNANMLLRTFGPGKRRDVPGHQEIEIGLSRLYRATGNIQYLHLAQFFLDERGRQHDGGLYDEGSPFAIYNGREYMQDHQPVLEQEEAVGHAVRATYMYAGMADVAALGNNPEYISAIDRLWDNTVSKKLYVTGGVGARHTSEAFGDAYELPNRTAYTETCAAVGNAFWNHRMFLLHGEGRYIDVLERILYNGLLSGLSLEGNRFFYQNPLESAGEHERSPWFEVSCCPGNLVRFIPSFPGYVYAQRDSRVYVNLYVQSKSQIAVDGTPVRIEQITDYPWEGTVRIKIQPLSETSFSLALRIPGWARNEPVPGDLYRFAEERIDPLVIKLNEREIDFDIRDGYTVIDRAWKTGDTVELDLPMPVRRILCHPEVKENTGRIALQRGPLVYCLEWPDNEGSVLHYHISDSTGFVTARKRDLLGGLVTIQGPAAEILTDGTSLERIFEAIPYFAWAHRGRGEMTVWPKQGSGLHIPHFPR